ncbi:excinuclease ABC subunit UvrB [Patescibacteria group bacterium]|nr:excinuclease ABC subunit UvrB [Patescibacteria group bacterium]
MDFKLVSQFKPNRDQEKARDFIVSRIQEGDKYSTLLGVTGSGKTFTASSIIEKIQKPTLVISHNKTLAAQLASEFKSFFPNNAVHYFVSYYDYYQPESYIPTSDTFINKETSVNEEIDRLRFEATTSLLSRKDVIIVASVSCIYGLGKPEDIKNRFLKISKKDKIKISEIASHLTEIQYERNDVELSRGKFRILGDIIEIHPANMKNLVYRIEFFGKDIEKISQIDLLNRNTVKVLDEISIPPASHYLTKNEEINSIVKEIEKELEIQEEYFKKNGKLIEAQRIRERVAYDIEMIKEIGYCNGIENYSRYLDGRSEGETPYTLIDYFGDDYLTIVDESHVTLPQIRGMYNGDRARKRNLIEYGFRLPSAYDNRPLRYEEFEDKMNQMVYMSATPTNEEIIKSGDNIVEQIIRPTGLLDPIIEVRKTENQIKNLVLEIQKNIKKNQRTLVITLTKKQAEDLTDYLIDLNIKVNYIHSDVKTMDRVDILRDLRKGKYDVLVGVNLLREGLDLPEVSLIGILDADKEGFLRSKTSLIQIIGRAARHSGGRIIMYADKITDSLDYAIKETKRRRKIQEKYNKENNITPTSIKKNIEEAEIPGRAKKEEKDYKIYKKLSKKDLNYIKENLEKTMLKEAKNMNFENASSLRDEILEIDRILKNKKF